MATEILDSETITVTRYAGPVRADNQTRTMYQINQKEGLRGYVKLTSKDAKDLLDKLYELAQKGW